MILSYNKKCEALDPMKTYGWSTSNGKPESNATAECEAEKGRLGIRYCYYESDYWAGAVKQCGGVQNMPTKAYLQKFASLLYDKPITLDWTQNLTYNGKASELGLPEPYFYLWAGNENNRERAYNRRFNFTYTDWNHCIRNQSERFGLCIVE